MSFRMADLKRNEANKWFPKYLKYLKSLALFSQVVYSFPRNTLVQEETFVKNKQNVYRARIMLFPEEINVKSQNATRKTLKHNILAILTMARVHSSQTTFFKYWQQTSFLFLT